MITTSAILRNCLCQKEGLIELTYLDFVLVQIFDFAVRVFGLLTKEKCLLKQKNMAFFSFSSELFWVEDSERILQESTCLLPSRKIVGDLNIYKFVERGIETEE